MTDKIYEKKKPIPIKIKQNNIKIYSWGFSKNGQTGIENCQYTPEPHNIKFQSPNNEIIKIISGENNSSFITKDYSTYIIGKNTFGQCCNNNNNKNNFNNNNNNINNKNIIYIPKLLPIKFIKISLGGEHILALTKDNLFYSWGLNIFGQCGIGHLENINYPTLIDKFGILIEQDNSIFLKEIYRNNINEDIIDFSAGAQHSMILTNKNNLYSCGFTKNGSLGYFNNNNENEPNESCVFTKIELNYFDKKIEKINCGVNHSCCIYGKNDILIWGNCENFEFEGIQRFNLFKLINNLSNDVLIINDNNNIENINLDLNNNKNYNYIKNVKLGENFLVLLTSDGKIYSSGNNEFGQLGIGKEEKKKLFEKVNLNEKIINISVGYNFAYALSENNTLYSWGNNKYGQCLNYEKNIIDTPFKINNFNNNKILQISCGGYHTCILIQGENIIFDENKKIILNKKFNPNEYTNKNLLKLTLQDNIKEKENLEKEIITKEQKINILTKEIEEKTKIKTEREKKNIEKTQNQLKKSPSNTITNSNQNTISKSNSNLKIETLLNEEIKLKELTFPENDYLGTGTFGEVRKAYWRKTLVAVKFLKESYENLEEQVIPFIEEFNLLKSLRHPNILLYIGGCISGPKHFLITEYCENGNLFEFLHGEKNNELNNIERLNFALEIAKGINYLHSFNPPILHRDLKSLNILLNSNFNIKIADFGWARLKNIHMTRMRGTFQWMAPEVILKENYTEKADVYSFGIILSELWSREPPYKGIPAKDVANMVKKDKNYRPGISKDVPIEIKELIKVCWDFEPQKRPSFLEIINYIEDYLRNLD